MIVDLEKRQISIGSFDTDKALYGLAFRTNISDKADAYATILKTSEETEFKVGAILALNKNIGFDINYKNKDIDNENDLKGFGFGLNYKF